MYICMCACMYVCMYVCMYEGYVNEGVRRRTKPKLLLKPWRKLSREKKRGLNFRAYMYVCVYVYMHVCMYICWFGLCVFTYGMDRDIDLSVEMGDCIESQKYRDYIRSLHFDEMHHMEGVYMCMYVCSMCMYVCTYVCMYVRMYVCNMCMYVSI